jgi:nitrate reductase beta subunit
MTDERKLKSYVFHGDQCYFVSTIMRDSSAVGYPSRYAETMTWEYDWKTNERGKIVDQDGSGDALTQHMRVVSDFYRCGKRKDEDDE